MRMLRATISLPTPLSPVIRTFASERAMRSTSCCNPTIAGLSPISCRCVFARIVARLLTRAPLSTSASLACKTFNQLTMLGRNGHERRADAITFMTPVVQNGSHSAHFDVRCERSSPEIQAQAPTSTWVYPPTRVEQNSDETDVQHLHALGGWKTRNVVWLDRYTNGSSSFFHFTESHRLQILPSAA